MKSKTKYVCTGTCHGVSPRAKKCGTRSCTRYGRALVKKK